MGGTRFNSRGIDNHGNVANFVETEFLLEAADRIFSMRQIRGSLPFYWDQFKGMKANLKIHQTEQINTNVMLLHFSNLKKKQFDDVVIFNLLSTKRAEEDNLTRYLTGLLKGVEPRNDLPSVHYEYLDFHGVTKETDFSPIDKDVVRLVETYNVGYNEWVFDKQEKRFQKLQTQKATIRTNCLDCLDRTNAAQTKIAFYVLALIVKKLDPKIIPQAGPDVLAIFEKADLVSFKNLRTLWADNGDMISLIYAGTGATTSSVTRKGDKSNLGSIFDHGYKTISRFYLNNFDDDFKQDVIDALLVKQATTVRQSTLPSFKEIKEVIQVSVISITSCRNNGNLTIGESFLKDIVAACETSSTIFFIAYIHTEKPVVVPARNLVFSTFIQYFKAFSEELGQFEVMQYYLGAKFETIILKRKDKAVNLSYFKSEDIKSSILTKPWGCRISLIVN